MRNWLRDLITEAVAQAIDERWPLLEVKPAVYNIQAGNTERAFAEARRLEGKRGQRG